MQLLTATGCRPEAWALCERWMARQTYPGPVRWIIVDDGEVAQPITFERAGWDLVVVRPWPRWEVGMNTQARNLRAGMGVVDRKHGVVFIEDDDWYAPDYLEWVAEALRHANLVGESCGRYYNVRTRVGRDLGNTQHASLCSTAAKGRALLMFDRVCAVKHKFIDLALWKVGKGRLTPGRRVLGIKGLPGRGGIGVGHRDTFSGDADQSGDLLRQWIGADADYYLPRPDGAA